MAAETEQELRREIADERRQLTEAVGSLREEIDHAAARAKKIGAVLGAAVGVGVATRIVLRAVRGGDDD